PDYEVPTDGTTSGSNTYIVQVKALDAAGNFSLQTITVTVLDVNEATAPVFTNTNATGANSARAYSFNYAENRASGATLGTVSATGTGTLTYSITAGNTPNNWFAIDATTGVITLTQAGSTSLANDFETQVNVQTLTVQVSDGTRTTTIEVALNETDLDDTAPLITGPSGNAGDATAAISVNENQTAVTTPTANEAVTWSLVGGEDQAKFAIDLTTGALTFV
ncbi:cadherin repeat domain-containing protein, partial [Sphingorhabdus rigui]